jgi:hypothetical protein
MSDPNDNDKKVDQTVKQLLDSGTRADLERWFGLPSYEALAERGIHPEPPADDSAYAGRRKQQATALAAVDPALAEAHHRRAERMADALKPREIALHIDPDMVQLDTVMIAKRSAIAEPRDVERPPDLEDALHDCTPQALLRDLHRPELNFDKAFEHTDLLESLRIDIAASIDEAMAASTRLPPAATSLFDEGYALLQELRAERAQPWRIVETPRRRVTE